MALILRTACEEFPLAAPNIRPISNPTEYVTPEERLLFMFRRTDTKILVRTSLVVGDRSSSKCGGRDAPIGEERLSSDWYRSGKPFKEGSHLGRQENMDQWH